MKTSRLTVATTVAACAVIAGCGQNEQVTTTSTTAVSTASPASTPSTPSATETSVVTETPTVTETTTDSETDASSPHPTATSVPTTTSAAPRTDAAKAPVAATVPETDPGDYADAAVAAWAQGDTATLKKYVSSSATAKLAGAAPSGELLRTACEDDMCSYTTEDGKRVTLTMDLAKVEKGQAGGITGVKVG